MHPHKPPVRPNFLPEDDRALNLAAPMPERAMASLRADMARTLDDSLTYAPGNPPRMDTLLAPHSPPPTTSARLPALVALHSCPRAHGAVLGADRPLRMGID
ncbi:hypothetical protein JB92DRAFT_3130249 [Gautieria morchelliformis]|nr:hypothetical protein JB92DRAFT_3130249 [Gautieria morchelliformis]